MCLCVSSPSSLPCCTHPPVCSVISIHHKTNSSAVKRTAAITTLAILLSTAQVNLVSRRHEEAAQALVGLLKRTLESQSTTVYEVGFGVAMIWCLYAIAARALTSLAID